MPIIGLELFILGILCDCIIEISFLSSYHKFVMRFDLLCRFGQVDDASWHFELSGKNIGSEIRQRLLRIEAHYVNTNKARKVKDWDGVLRESTLCIEAGVDASNQVI